ncbi:acetyl-CoA carboxylase biotin carboxyl carrier protein [Leptolyngbya sp. NIES-2104]|uniref:acetyl-CoA carboxylase biotin carboxyl carrier protein n=1 Tax=Leptolyngbya sp. NIES-2104 TaxID=1552121 RepID=UPI0006ECBDF0|nr:acetyl-CoA carboxylase biotin carboxyl carrier protein [Leptolyngbya sp. NIES-2104]GAP95902.1 biotin carboxyl carrier protein of acetyl-CoA carboxylase [Leptolyngbya sp. NIES-2104]
MPLDLTELRELLTALNQTDISELTLKADDFELTVRRGSRVEMTSIAPVAVPQPSIAPPPEPIKSEAPSPAPIVDRKLAEVVSPIVGTFYRSPSPDELPFVDIGNRIQKGQVVCIIEAMKVMNEIEAEVSGEIVEILVQNGQPVEYGQPLMRVNPA